MNKSTTATGTTDAATAPAKPGAGQRPAKRQKAAPPRRVSAFVVDRRDPRPIIFNYGANLTRHEREKAKERLAMAGVAVVALLCVLVLAWGWTDQNIIAPAQAVATVNGTDIRQDAYGHMQKWQTLQLQSQLSQTQQQAASVGSDKKNAALSQYFQQQVQQLQAQQQTIPSDTMTKMVEAIVIKGSARSQFSISASKADLDKQLASIQKALGGATSYKNALDSTGLSDDEFRRWVVEPGVLGTKVQDQLGKTISPLGPPSVHARHILVKTKALAQTVMAQLQHGGNWKTLAKKYSTDTGTKDKGGDLGTFAQGTMVAPFDKAAFSMKPGEIRLVQSTFGWHVVQVLSKPVRTKLTATELTTKKSQVLSDWIKKQIQGARITPSSAIPNFSSGLGGSSVGTTGQ